MTAPDDVTHAGPGVDLPVPPVPDPVDALDGDDEIAVPDRTAADEPERLVTLEVHGVAAGGDGVGRDGGGRVVFVRGALPGEEVVARLADERSTFARGEVAEVRRAAASRREAPCVHAREGCGGCGWQHVDPAEQARLRVAIVTEALERIGKVVAPVVVTGPDLPVEGYRTTLRCGVIGGRAGFRLHHSHDLLAVDSCLIAHPLVDDLVRNGRFGSAREVTLRAGARTGERLVLAHPHARGIEVPDDVVVVGSDKLRRGQRAWYHEEVAGRRWRVSASSFFQCRPDGAEALIDLVAAEIAQHDGDPSGTLVDLCAGVGLFSATVGAGRHVVAVERHAPAVADARVNLAGLDVRLVRSSMEGWRPSPASVVVADPARSGLGRAGVDVVAATGAGLVVLVSCDPASLGRDAGLLAAAGYRQERTTVVDLFAQTPHVEAVTAFVST